MYSFSHLFSWTIWTADAEEEPDFPEIKDENSHLDGASAQSGSPEQKQYMHSMMNACKQQM